MTNKPIPPVTSVNKAFWEGTAQGLLLVRACQNCGARFRFTTDWCPKCWSLDVVNQQSSGLGSVIGRTIVHMAPYAAYAADVPYVLALVQLDDGPVMMSNVIGCDPDTVQVDMRVQVEFEPRGDIMLPMFRPI